MSQTLVSVLIPMWNEQRHIAATLDSLLAQEGDVRLEILIADGASTDDSVAVVEEYQRRHANIVLLHNPSRSTAIGRNLCLERSRGEIVLNFSAHALAPPECVGILTRKLLAAPVEVAGVGVANVSPEDDSFSACVIGVVYASLLGGVKNVDQNARFERDTEVPSVAFTAYRAREIKSVGGFDPLFWCGQDFELNYRLGQAGYKLLFTPDAVVYRYNRASVKAFWRQMTRYGTARGLILRKHPASFRWSYLVPSLFLFYSVVGALMSAVSSAVAMGFLLSMAAYACLGWGSSLLVSRDLLPVLVSPLFYFIMHIGYGYGLIKAAGQRRFADAG